MKEKKEISSMKKKTGETITDLKNNPYKKNAVKKGYNEKNPSQPEGAFKPDSVNKKD